ncbi:MAG: YidC/Oxa1 family membrane protein insertase [Bacilli bacterium]|nr:YidC/Oxa1 family membrane protein insertase [Bacilli bacterium]
MKKINKKLVLLLLLVFLVTGCTTQLKDGNNKAVQNPTTGQTLTKNILCQPEDEETRGLYLANNINIEEMPKCENFSPTDGGYDGVWSSLIVKPLAWLIIKLGSLVKDYGLGLILTSLIIRLIAFPLTRKTAMQSELMKNAKPELDKLEKKYEGKKDQESMMKKSNEMAMIYRKYNINPIAGCLFALIQIPLFIGFLEAINRVPAIFEGTFAGFQLGTTPMTGYSNGNFIYLILTGIVAASTYFSLKMNSASNPDNDQMKMMGRIMFFMILITSIFMTSALNIYWITTNLFTVVQNILVKRQKEKV